MKALEDFKKENNKNKEISNNKNFWTNERDNGNEAYYKFYEYMNEMI